MKNLGQEPEEKETRQDAHTEDGRTTENEDWEEEEAEEEEESSIAHEGQDVEGPLEVPPQVLDWEETCEALHNRTIQNEDREARPQKEKKPSGRCSWSSQHCHFSCRCEGTISPQFFDCPDCGKQFTLGSHLIRHQRVHPGERLFGCRSCPKSFSQRSDLVRPERTHAGVKLCTQCEKSFSEGSHLLRHQMIHSGEKPFKCNMCGKRYGDSSYLTVHQRGHTGARPYCCTCCGKSFGRSSTLICHQRVHGDPAPFPGDNPRPRGIWTAFACLPGDGVTEPLSSEDTHVPGAIPCIVCAVPAAPSMDGPPFHEDYGMAMQMSLLEEEDQGLDG